MAATWSIEGFLRGTVPDGFAIPSDLDLSNQPALRRLPDRMNIWGSLRLGGCTGLEELPQRLYVGDSLVLRGCTLLRELPAGIECDSIDLSDCTSLRILPERFKAKSLILRGCTALERLPERLEVGHLDLRGCTSLARLPEGLQLGRLDVRGCSSLRELPPGLGVEGDLLATVGRIRPPLRVGGDLDLSDATELQALPEGVEVGGRLIARRSGLRRLPAALGVGGDVIVEDCGALEALPQGLQVKGSLRLGGCGSLRELPPGLGVGGDLAARRSQLLRIAGPLRVGGSLDLRDSPSLESLPAALELGRSLLADGCERLSSLPEGLSVPGSLSLVGCRSLGALPRGLSVGGNLRLEGSGAAASAVEARVGGLLIRDLGARPLRSRGEPVDVPLRALAEGFSGALALSPDGSRLVAALGKELLVLDTASGERLAGCDAPEHGPHDLALSPDGGSVLVGAGFHHRAPRGDFVLWNLSTGEQRELGPLCEVRRVGFGPGGRVAYGVDRFHEGLWVVELASGEPLLRTGPDWVRSGFVGFDPSGGVFGVTMGRDEVTLHDGATFEPLDAVPCGGGVLGLLDRHGTLLQQAAWGLEVRTPGGEPRQVRLRAVVAVSVAARVALIKGEEHLSVCGLDDARPIFRTTHRKAHVARLSEDGATMAVATADGRLSVASLRGLGPLVGSSCRLTPGPGSEFCQHLSASLEQQMDAAPL